MLVQIQTRQPKLTSITHFWARMRAVSAALAATALAAKVSPAQLEQARYLVITPRPSSSSRCVT